ncbi:hypothetical protein RchiOBHm_Chr1g0359731 [Rosa chinensis]|uniref:Uncharacterized protein n=1 Tax=Rosa chinensis TaxID=74649 RepID=A0A2P6SIK1_ROSCH|nr:hypothetical protein RchiOBHm_Chr1g0359731 [Rosa chinensis]
MAKSMLQVVLVPVTIGLALNTYCKYLDYSLQHMTFQRSQGQQTCKELGEILS